MPTSVPNRSRIVAIVGAVALLGAACTGGTGPGRASLRPSQVVYRLQTRQAAFSLTAPVEREVAASLDNVIYLAGGLDLGGHSASGVYSLNPSTGRLDALGSVPQPFHDAAGAILEGRLYVFGGGAGESSGAVQAFDLQRRRGSVAGRLPHSLSDLSAATVNGTVYLFGGWDGSSVNATIYSTTDGTHFRVAGRLPQGLRYTAVAVAGGRVVISGGITASGGPVATVSLFDPSTGRVSTLGRLASPVAHASAFSLQDRVYVAGGQDAAGGAVRSVVEVDVRARSLKPVASLPFAVSDAGTVAAAGSAWLIGGSRGGAVSQIVQATLQPVVVSSPPTGPAPTVTVNAADVRPFAGLLLIADRGNNRLLVMNAEKHIVWRYPDPSLPPPPFRFYFPDDAFWVHGGHAILLSEEENEVVQEIAYPSGETVWSYGHPGVPGSAKGYLNQPDDIYPYPGGGAVVADAKNCRIVFFDAKGRVSRQIGKTGNADVPSTCVHGLPDHVGYPNGDTPLPSGDLLISELRSGGWIDEVTSTGRPVWQRRVPGIHLPSDPQRLSDGSFLTVDYNTPGRIVRFTSDGRVLWDYFEPSGQGELSNPSLAAPLPNGLVGVNDDFKDRLIFIDPATSHIVWQYGHDGSPGTGKGYLNLPDGFDILFPGGVTPLHVDFATQEVVKGRP